MVHSEGRVDGEERKTQALQALRNALSNDGKDRLRATINRCQLCHFYLHATETLLVVCTSLLKVCLSVIHSLTVSLYDGGGTRIKRRIFPVAIPELIRTTMPACLSARS